MSNLKSARQAIEAELKHVERGIEFYQARAATLRQALEQLANIEDPQTPRVKAAKQGAAKPRKGKSAGKGKAGASRNALPRTPTDYWLQFITHQPKSAVEIANAAIAALGFTPNTEQVKKMKQRVAPALHALLSAKKIKDVGSGRQRRFFLPLAKSAGQTKQQAKGKTTHVETDSTLLH